MRLLLILSERLVSNGSIGRSSCKSALEALIYRRIMAVGLDLRTWRLLRSLPVWSRDADVYHGSIRMRVYRVLLTAHSCKYSIIGVMLSVIFWALMAPLTLGKI